MAALCLPQVAFAQAEPEPEPEPVPAATEDTQELSDEGIADEPDDVEFSSDSGIDDNPEAPNSIFADENKDQSKAKSSAEAANSGYPSRVIDRPLNLPGGMVQVALDLPVSVDPFAVSGTLTGSYGITSDVEIALQYSPGRYGDDFAVGRAVALQTQYLVTDFLAAELSIPMYLDPFAIGVVAAAPFRYEFFDKFAIVAGRDFLSVKIHEFLPSIENATSNDALIAARENNQIVPVWAVNLAAGAIYQLDDKLALDAEFGSRFDDTNAAAAWLMNVGVLYANTNKLDFGARVSAADLAKFTETLSLRVFLNVRI